VSWWVYLEDRDGATVHVTPHAEGGTFALGGTNHAELNVTYNYGRHFRFPDLHGQVAIDTVPELQGAVARLGTDRDPDYWQPTAGNAGATCALLLAWAQEHPTARWRVS
jgi:hypothetical protein